MHDSAKGLAGPTKGGNRSNLGAVMLLGNDGELVFC